ncbi:RRXRR domain-containing protein [Coleofasciculus sp. E2-BRE-01]|uniref:RRXRR domain-containing protein n=1 Tax=Coleofasciculus sp. E2-BRE-01 TaxID=3069524 RepID=UPI0032FD6641
MYRVPVISKKGKPLMPTKPSRARRWLKEGKVVIHKNDLQQFAVQLTVNSGEETQPVAVGIDPGKHYSGIGVQSGQATLFTAHLELPFQKVKDRMEQRAMMRRGRRGRRINRKLPFNQRAHRQKRFDNRRGHKLPPSIKANRQLEYRVVKELSQLFPICSIVYEIVKARGDKGFSPVMVGQKVMTEKWLPQIAPVTTKYGWETWSRREFLGLEKDQQKSNPSPATHAVDGVALASHQFLTYRQIKGDRGWHEGRVEITNAPFLVIKRPPVSRRQLHLMLPAQGGVRRKYGGTITRHNFRKGDYVEAERKGSIYRGWVSGDTKSKVSISNFDWKRIAQFSKNKVELLQRSTGLICKQETAFVGATRC